MKSRPGAYSLRVLFLLTGLVLLLLLMSAASVSAAKKPEFPPRFGFGYVPSSPDLAEDLGQARTLKGLVIAWVHQGSPAEKAGLTPGDVLVKVQKQKGKPVEVPDAARYDSATKGMKAEQDWTFYVMRGAKEMPISMRPVAAQLGPQVQPAPGPTPAIIKVAPDGSGQARTITGALLKARPGDTVLVAGTQASSPVWLDRLTITSLDPAAPAEVAGLEIGAVSGVRVSGLSFVAPAGSELSQLGVFIYDAKDVTVEGCEMRGFSEGIRVVRGEGVVLERNTVSQNVGGINVQNSTVKISRNLVLRNAKEAKWFNFAGGICVWGGSAEIIQNTVLENQVSAELFRTSLGAVTGVGILIINGNAVIANNLVVNNTIGVMVGADSKATVEYNDVIGHSIQGGTWNRGNNEYHLQSAAANFLTQISYEYKPQPIFPIINFDPNRHFYTPSLQFQPSPTNLMVDPLFADRLKGDYRLAPDSPLINRGRGGTYIGALPPVVVAPAATSSPATTATAAAGGAPSTTVAAGAPSLPTSPSTPQSTARGGQLPAQAGDFRVTIQAGTLYVQAEAVDTILARLLKRLADNQPALEQVKKDLIGAVPFALVGLDGTVLGSGLAEDLTTALINTGLRPVDTGLLQKILAEVGAKDSSQVDQALAQEIGRRTNCASLLVGSLSDRGPTVVLSVRLVDTKTGEYLAAERLELVKMTK